MAHLYLSDLVTHRFKWWLIACSNVSQIIIRLSRIISGGMWIPIPKISFNNAYLKMSYENVLTSFMLEYADMCEQELNTIDSGKMLFHSSTSTFSRISGHQIRLLSLNDFVCILHIHKRSMTFTHSNIPVSISEGQMNNNSRSRDFHFVTKWDSVPSDLSNGFQNIGKTTLHYSGEIFMYFFGTKDKVTQACCT